MKKAVDIEAFAKEVSKRINYLVETHEEIWLGEDLMLAGAKGLDPKAGYKIQVPIKDFSLTPKDHENKILYCYRKGRGPSVRRYLEKYFEKVTVNQIMELL